MPFIPTTALTTGVERQTQTRTVTTDPDTFTAAPVFDCGVSTLVTARVTATVFVPDGETFGVDPGEIQGQSGVTFESLDGITYVQSSPILTNSTGFPAGGFISAGEYFLVVSPTLRFLRIGIDIEDSNFQIYAGPNHPTITFQIDLEYL